MTTTARYDVFLCHNSHEKDAATRIEEMLRQEGVGTFLDHRDLVPGTSLPTEIARAFAASATFVVLIGPSGIGPGWQSEEIAMAVHRAVQEEGFRILVVLLPGARRDGVPAGLAHRHGVDFSSGIEDPERLERLLQGIRGTTAAEREVGSRPVSLPSYRSMAPPGSGFVARSELTAVLQALIETEVSAAQPGATMFALTTALRGAGGFGKTALAQAICEDPGLRRRFPAGILWTTLGQHAGKADRLARVRDLLRWWRRREPPSFETLEAAASELRTELSGKPVLLVADDVWLVADVEPFSGLAPPAALLLTTRNSRAVPHGARAVVVDALELPRAVELLGQGLVSLPPAATVGRLARRLGEWPILLRLVNSQLHEEQRSGLTGEAAFRAVESALDDVGLTAFDREDEAARNLAVRRTVEASLQRLAPLDRQRYGQMAVFAEDERAPLAVLALLWEAEAAEVCRLCRRLAEMSLLHAFDPVGGIVQLHDVMRSYLLREHRDLMPSRHAALAARYSAARLQGRTEEATDLYFVAHLPYHLKQGGAIGDLQELLFSAAWLAEKTAKAGVNAAIADYRLLPDDGNAASVQEAMRLARPALTKDGAQLAGQLHGRLDALASPTINALLAGAAARQTGPWLRPLVSKLQRPGGACVFAFPAHAGRVGAIVQLDLERFATAGADGEIRMWNFASGELCTVLASTGTPLRRLALVSPARLLAAGDDGAVRLWDLDREEVVRTFEGNPSPVTALRLRGEEFVTGHDDGTLLLWSLDAARPPRRCKGHTARIHDAGFLDARTVVSISKDRTLRVWNTVSARQLHTATFPMFAGEALDVTASNEVFVGTFGGVIQIWKPRSPDAPPRQLLRHRAVALDAILVLSRRLGASSIGGQSAIHASQSSPPLR